MKKALLAVWMLLLSSVAIAQQKNEEALVNKIIQCFGTEDDSAYAMLFPRFDTLWNMAQRYSDTGIVNNRRINNLRSNPRQLQQFDPYYNKSIIRDFKFIHKKGLDSGIHWRDLLIARYDLEKAMLPRELVGFEKIVQYRLQGYIFVQDLLTRKIYCIAIKDVHGFNDKWYGGRIVNILEAETIEEYYEKLALERKVLKDVLIAQLYALSDTIGKAEDSLALAAAATNNNGSGETVAKTDKANPLSVTPEEDEEKKKPLTNDVVERKLYTGLFDGEIKMELYIRSLKGPCPKPVCAWDALYKFQDMEDYVVLDVTKSPEGKLILTEEDVGVMEITITGDKATGEWSSFKDKTTVEVELTEKREVKNRKLFMLDDILEGGMNFGEY